MLKCFTSPDSISSFERSTQSSLYMALGRIFLVLCITNPRPGWLFWSIMPTVTSELLCFIWHFVQISAAPLPPSIHLLICLKKKVRTERKPESILWFWDEVHGQFLSSKLHHGSVISRWCRDSHVVSAFTHLHCYQTWKSWNYIFFKKKLCLVDFACRNQWSQSKTANPVTICHCRQASATHSTSL